MFLAQRYWDQPRMVSCESPVSISIITSIAWCLLHLITHRYLETLLGIAFTFQVEPENEQFLPLLLYSSNHLSKFTQNRILSTEYFFSGGHIAQLIYKTRECIIESICRGWNWGLVAQARPWLVIYRAKEWNPWDLNSVSPWGNYGYIPLPWWRKI